ncbi:unnamed protein product [Paramecium octaurelia]|uniref:Uncharacterized protein n=1 Tax=Paramecium octaurelia TaxID=43137 RepID=A0A8S1Y126_PAROT|nr:unnamed protein product [Paramecium octaurelia]
MDKLPAFLLVQDVQSQLNKIEQQSFQLIHNTQTIDISESCKSLCQLLQFVLV